MKCKGKLISKAGAQSLGVLAHFSVIHTGPDKVSVYMVKQLSRGSAGTGKGSSGSRLCCPTAHITELTLLIAFLSQLCAAGLSHQDCRSGRQLSPACSSHTAKRENNSKARPASPSPAQPSLCCRAPDQVLP